MIFKVNADPHRRMPWPLRDQLHATLTLQLIVYVVAECLRRTPP
jgi:hypothetical protein